MPELFHFNLHEYLQDGLQLSENRPKDGEKMAKINALKNEAGKGK